jgi:hypothetical protein
MLSPQMRRRIFQLTEVLRQYADVAVFAVFSLGATCFCLTWFDLSLPFAAPLWMFFFAVIPALLMALGLLDRFSVFIAAPFIKQVSEAELQTRIDKVNKVILGWYDSHGFPPERVVTIRTYTQLDRYMPEVNLRVTISHSYGNAEIPEFCDDKDLQDALHDIIVPEGTSMFRLRALNIANDGRPQWMKAPEVFTRQTILNELSSHERLACLSAYQSLSASRMSDASPYPEGLEI